ncbi:LOW QUALITY PROTEIN: HERV-H LTR-associating protein 2 [Sylvia borin]
MQSSKFDMNVQTNEKMKGQNMPAVMISLFCTSATLWNFTEQEEVTELFSKDCILPCHFPPGHEEVIHWSKENKKSSCQQKDQLEEQDPHLRRLRTHLFQENIPSGNASLRLRNLPMTGEGSYTCVGTAQGQTEVEVLLRVRAPSSYALEYQNTNTERRLKCYAFLSYPAPNSSWVQGSISIQTDREETRNGVLYSLRSDKDIINMTDYCHIHFHHEVWAAEWKMQDLFNVEGGSPVIPCEHGSDTARSFSVVWALHRDAVTSVLASSNGTFHSHQPRVRGNEIDFSLVLDPLTAGRGQYLCNISTPLYTKLTVRTLHVGKLLLLPFQRMRTS